MKKCLSKLMIAQLFVLAALTAHAQEFPSYQLAPGSLVCPRAADENNYTTSYLKSFKKLVLGKEDWLFRTGKDLLMTFGPDDASLKLLKQLSDTLKQKGVQLMIVYVPTRGLLHNAHFAQTEVAQYQAAQALANYRHALERIRQQDILVADYSTLITVPQEHDYYFKRDHHWSPYGARATAALVADYIKTQPIYQDLPKKVFINRHEGVYGREGTLQLAWKNLCDQQFHKQFVDKYVNDLGEQDSGSAEDALFSDEAEPAVTLVGTSFSADLKFNFVGFLREYMGVDIVNEAIEGDGFEGSILQLLNNPQFLKAPPKLLIWELPAYYQLDERPFYRQAMPLLNSSCAGKKPVLQETVKLKPGKNEFLFNAGDADSARVDFIDTKNHFMELQFSDTRFNTLDMVIWHLNGRRDVLKIERSDTNLMNGRFVFNLKDEADWGNFIYLSSEINIPPEYEDLSVSVSLCQR